MKQAKDDGSSTRMKTEPVTREQRFHSPASDHQEGICSFRAGIPVSDALEHAHCMIDTVQRALREMAESEECDSTSICYALSFTLENANAAIYACMYAKPAAEPSEAGRA